MVSLCFEQLLSQHFYLLLQSLLSLPVCCKLLDIKLSTLQLLSEIHYGGLSNTNNPIMLAKIGSYN